MRTHYVRHSDGAPVTVDEAMLHGVLRPGYRMSVGLVMSDAARAAVADGLSVSFIDHLPAHMLPHLTRLAEDTKSNEIFRAQAAANTARRMADEITRTQSAGPASAQAALYVTGIADRAQARAAALGGNPAPQTTPTPNTKDQSMDIQDSIQGLPDGIRSKVCYAIADMRSDSRTQIESGINTARSLLYSLKDAQTSGSNPLIGDAGQVAANWSSITAVADHLGEAINKAHDRAANAIR